MPSTLFQKIFFSIIFIVTILACIQMWVDHKENVRKGECITRSEALLLSLTGGDSPAAILIEPFDPILIDSVRILAGTFRPRAGFFNYRHSESDSIWREEIAVTPLPEINAPRDKSGAAIESIHIQWSKAPSYSTWRAKVTLRRLTADSLFY